MFQLIFDGLILTCLALVIGGLTSLSKQIQQLSRRPPTWTQDEIDKTERLEIAAGIREPNPTPAPRKALPTKCMCGHMIGMHKNRKKGGSCTVAGRDNRVCACEWAQEDVVAWFRGDLYA